MPISIKRISQVLHLTQKNTPIKTSRISIKMNLCIFVIVQFRGLKMTNMNYVERSPWQRSLQVVYLGFPQSESCCSRDHCSPPLVLLPETGFHHSFLIDLILQPSYCALGRCCNSNTNTWLKLYSVPDTRYFILCVSIMISIIHIILQIWNIKSPAHTVVWQWQ